MDIVYISGSPRKGGNTDYLLKQMQKRTGGNFIKLSDYSLGYCDSCWECLKKKTCVVDDDLSNIIIPQILAADVLVLGSPVYFNNVSGIMKSFIDRTWAIRGQLRNKIGGAVVVGRRYGAEGAISALSSFFLKHEMIVANRGVEGIAFDLEEIDRDEESMAAVVALERRIEELSAIMNFC